MVLTQSIAFGHILAIFTMVVWGATFSSTKALLGDFVASEILLLRFFIAYILLLLLLPKPLQWRGIRAEIWLFCAGLSGSCLYFLLENVALYFTSVANTALLVCINPIFTALLGSFILKKSPSKYFFIGFIIASVGVGLVVFRESSFSLSLLGDFLCLLAGIVWSIYTLVLEHVFKIFKGQSPTLITRKIFFYGILCTLPFMVFEISQRGDFSFMRFLVVENLLNLFFLGFVASALCYLSWNATLKILGIYQASAYIYSIPLFGVLIAVVTLGERLDFNIILGGILVLLGLFLSQKH